MQKIKMSRGVTLTFEEGCKKYLENCRQRNLREGTINHYRQSYWEESLNGVSVFWARYQRISKTLRSDKTVRNSHFCKPY